MDRISDNALAVARHLKAHGKVAWVNYAGLEDHPDHRLMKKYLSGKASGLAELRHQGAGRGGPPAWRTVPRRAEALHATGEHRRRRSLATHPASTTHRQWAPEELEHAGVGKDIVRLSIGIEHINDLRADLAQALGVGSE